MMLPSSPQLAPRPRGASHSVTAAPPSTEIFLSLPSAKNPIHSPSGEKNGQVGVLRPRQRRDLVLMQQARVEAHLAVRAAQRESQAGAVG